MNFILQILAFGLWPALPVTGYAILSRMGWEQRVTALPKLSFFAIQCVIGLILWSAILIMAAYWGLFQGHIFGAFGWLISIYGCWKIIRNRELSTLRQKIVSMRPLQNAYFCSSSRKAKNLISGIYRIFRGLNFEPDAEIGPKEGLCKGLSMKWDWLLAIGLMGALGLYALFPAETIRGGRDMGVYTNQAIYTATHGSLFIPYPEDEQIRKVVKDHHWVLPGFAGVNGKMSMLFPDIYSLWLSQAFASLGAFGLFRLNSIFSLLSLTVFYGLLRVAFNHKMTATLATLFLAFNVSQIWVTRQTLTEIFQQMIFWSGILIFIISHKTNNHNFARLAGIVTGFTALVRIDSFFIFPLFIFGHVLMNMTHKGSKWTHSGVVSAFYQMAVPVFFLSLTYYFFLKPKYFLMLQGALLHIGYAILAALFFLLFSHEMVFNKLEKIIRMRMVAVGGVIFFFAAGLFAYWIRPITNPDAINHIDQTAVNIGKYISPIGFWSGWFGWLLLLYQMISHQKNTQFAIIFVIVGGFAALYLWRPSITPDHYWAIRRFVPIVIPGFIFCGAFLWWRLMYLIPGRFFIPIVLILSIYLVTMTYQNGALIFTFPEHKGAYSALVNFSKELPTDQPILVNEVHNGELSTPLFVSFGKLVQRANFNTPHDARILTQWLKHQKKQEKPLCLLSNTGKLPSNLDTRLISAHRLPYATTQQAVMPLPQKNLQYDHRLLLYEIRGVNDNVYHENLIARDILGIKKSGFYEIEKWGEKFHFQWTNGDAVIVIPLLKRKPEELVIDIASMGVKNNRIQIYVNGKLLFDENPSGNLSSINIPLNAVNFKYTMVVKIVSKTFYPDTDKRRLGIAIKRVVVK